MGMGLHTKTCIVTGGASGLGKAMVRRFAQEGADVACVDLNSERLGKTRTELADCPGEVLGIEADIRSWKAVKSMVRSTNQRFGHVDVLVNNAGVTQRTVTGGDPRDSIGDLPVDVWDTVLDTNLRGPFLCTKAVLPDMIASDHGRLIHISSGMGRDASNRGGYAPYVASKHGLEGFCECLADELSDTGVSSLVLRPPDGAVYTQTRDYLPKSERDDRHHPEVITEAAVQLATGGGENGGRYVATADGSGVEPDR